MSATRLLVLGMVRLYGRAHGYRIGSALESWGAHEWANVKWGSIYHALKKMTAERLLESTETPGWPGRTDYRMTEQGDAEFLRLLRDALRRPSHRPDVVTAGLAMLPALPREEVLELLGERLGELESERAGIRRQTGEWTEPGHVRELFDLWVHTLDSGADWTRGLITRLSDGAYVMAGERGHSFGPGSWSEPGS